MNLLRLRTATSWPPLLLLAACGTGPSAAENLAGGGDVASLAVSPDTVTLSTEAGAPATQDFTAVATFGDGSTGALDLVTWELSNASVGAIDSRGHFTSVDTNGGEATITATFLDQSATATLELVHHVTYVEDGVDQAAADALGAVDSGDSALTVLYPFDHTTVPRNLDGLQVSWTGSQMTDVIRLHFASALESVDVYTTGATAWSVPTEVWEAASATNRRGELTLQVFSAAWDGSTLGAVSQSEPVHVTVNRFDAPGSVLYWSTVDRAIMRILAGGGTADRFYPTSDTGQCYGCHEISESRQWMVVTRDGVNGTYQVIDIADPDNPRIVYDTVDTKRMTFHALSPDGKTVLGVTNGSLVLYDLATNALLATANPDSYKYTHPGWSPDGKRAVAVRVTGGMLSDMGFFDGEIVTMTWDGVRLSDPEVLVPAQKGVNYYYPSFSPDGDWVVFNRSTDDSYADVDAELWLIPSIGGAAIRLDNANGVGEQRNSLARWAPLPDDDVLWLAFSSRQKKGGEGSANASQIWVTAIDPSLAQQGLDPSAAPYWLPGQNSGSDNHLPVWWSQ